MRAVLPGKPQARLQAVSTQQWQGRRIVVYISGSALVILGGPDQILQTIYHDDEERLDAVALDEASGKIAVSSRGVVFLYRPHGIDEGALRWSLQSSLRVEDAPSDMPLTLSWGASEELLVGGSSLRLFSTAEAQTEIWTQDLANPVKFAQFSYDATFIASTAQYDRLVKIWRRISFGSDEVRFDFTYLPHPGVVTAMYWRRPHHRDQTIDNVLYTVSADDVLRIWAATDPHGLQNLQLWGQVDLQESIKPRLWTLTPSSKRFVFIIDGRDMMTATERAVHCADQTDTEHHALDHLVEVARRSPEVCVILDGEGRMSAWGFENVGCKNKQTTNIFNIAHIEGLDLRLGQGAATPEQDHIQIHNFCGDLPGSEFTVLIHRFDGSVEWMEGRVDALFDPSPRDRRLASRALWSGHAESIKKINRTVSGTALVSRTSANESILWKQSTRDAGRTALTKQSDILSIDRVRKTCILEEGDYVVILHDDKVSLWDTRQPNAVRLAHLDFALKGRALCLMSLPGTETRSHVAYVATISSEMEGIAWEVRLPSSSSSTSTESPTQVNGHLDPVSRLTHFANFDLGTTEDLVFVVPVDPAGSDHVISGFVDVFARDVAISYTRSGTLKTWTAKVDVDASAVHWLLTASVETAIDAPSLASGSSIRKAALADHDQTGLTIWDTRGGQLEFEQRFEAQDVIQDLDWTATPDDQSILAVGFPHRVLLLCQMRFDYLEAGPAWATVREIRIRDMTPHPIGDSTWLSSGHLIVGAGNQLFVYDQKIEITDRLIADLRIPAQREVSNDLFNVVSRLNGPLPVFHPQFLAQCILRGKLGVVQRILVTLHEELRFFAEGDELHSFLHLPLETFYAKNDTTPARKSLNLRRSYPDISDDPDGDGILTEALAASLNEKLAQIKVPRLSGSEQLHLANITDCVALVEKHRRSMDDNASRYMLFFRGHVLRAGTSSSLSHVRISWREITWAMHSGSQDILVDLVSRQFQGRMLWTHARESGLFMWLQDPAAIKIHFENIARNQYTRTDAKDPIDCSLYYLALRKKNVLLGLWRMAGWHREQRATQKLLANDFRDPRWKTAALKNAYALMGRHRFEYAAAFFLLADDLPSAIAICLTHLDDLQLAITLARVYGGDSSPELSSLLTETVLPLAARTGNRWLATWAFWLLNQRARAVRALVAPLHSLLDTPASPNLAAKSFRTNDPALVIFYHELREKTLQTLQGALAISGGVEWEFVLGNAKLYDRMGCDLLALELVTSWEFLRQSPKAAATRARPESPVDPRKMLRRRSSLVVADLPVSPGKGAGAEKGKGGGGKGQPTMFEEPSGSSLLDSFGF